MKNRLRSAAALAMTLVTAGCEKPAEAPAQRLSGPGESCLKTADCADGLGCFSQTCAVSGAAPAAPTPPAAAPAVDPALPAAGGVAPPLPPVSPGSQGKEEEAAAIEALAEAFDDSEEPLAAPTTAGTSAFTVLDYATRFPTGDRAAADKLNAEGLKLRKAGQNGAALASYLAALEASPAHEAARYNTACERALAEAPASREAALRLLEELASQNTRTARIFVAEARFDPDFAAVSSDPRFLAVIGTVAMDLDAPFGKQLCGDPARIASLVDPTRGLVDYLEQESATEQKAKPPRTRKALGRGAFLAALEFARRLKGDMCDPAMREDAPELTLYQSKLADKPREGHTCLAYSLDASWTEWSEICLVPTAGGGWRIASTIRHPTGPMDNTVWDTIVARATAARRQGLALHGVTLP
jgi:hypothetical protein